MGSKCFALASVMVAASILGPVNAVAAWPHIKNPIKKQLDDVKKAVQRAKEEEEKARKLAAEAQEEKDRISARIDSTEAQVRDAKEVLASGSAMIDSLNAMLGGSTLPLTPGSDKGGQVQEQSSGAGLDVELGITIDSVELPEISEAMAAEIIAESDSDWVDPNMGAVDSDSVVVVEDPPDTLITTPPNPTPRGPAVHPTLECPLVQGKAGETVIIPVQVTDPAGRPMDGIQVTVTVKDAAGNNIVGLARTDDQGTASIPYVVNWEFSGTSTSKRLLYCAIVERSARALSSRLNGYIIVLR